MSIYIYTNKGSEAQVALKFALWCIENDVDVLNCSTEEFGKYKRIFDKEYYISNGWYPTEEER
jgi:hypothetical protein